MATHARSVAGLDFGTFLLLLLPPLFWAGNAVVGRLMVGTVPPLTLNFLRWALAVLLLLPWAYWVLRPGSGVWQSWRRFLLLGLLGIGSYNGLQYLALLTSSPINVTLVASMTPVLVLILGRLFYGVSVSRGESLGAGLSIVGVLVVLARGDWHRLTDLQPVLGDVFMVLASVIWAVYSWLLARPPLGSEPAGLRSHWAGFLMAQMLFGVAWTGIFAASEWALWPVLVPEATALRIEWGWPLALAIFYVAVGPSILAYRAWGAAVARVGPALAAVVVNLTPLFAALLSVSFLGDTLESYHVAGFVLSMLGIWLSSRASQRRQKGIAAIVESRSS
jgi:drug/metabolite transporter (DMT)-like permease